MDTQVRTPHAVFMMPQRFMVPLFQRPYVWTEESQWEPLWDDIVRVAERVLNRPFDKHQPHFLGAVVLQQVQNQAGQMQQRTIIDGQQRLTTLQLLLHALYVELLSIDASAPAMRIEPLVRNADAFCSMPDDRFKVGPTNRDRPGFNAVMGAYAPVNYDATGYSGEKIVRAHRFFSERARDWLSRKDPASTQKRAAAIETVARDLLQIVVIDLAVDENAQEIFETLNARGEPLSPADLIKNFIFQRLLDAGTNVDDAYQKYWKDFETGFWEVRVSLGRLHYPRSAIFLNHWLVARTGEEVVAREVFDQFKRFADRFEGSMHELLRQVHAAAGVYREFIAKSSASPGATERLGLFGYRTSALESEVIKPLVLCLFDPEEPTIPEAQLIKALNVVESWMVRRMLVRATTKSYSQVMAELVAHVRKTNRATAGDTIERYLADQSSSSRYWPDDTELQDELITLPAYRRLGRGRLRMVLEAIEDHLRGWHGNEEGLGGERVTKGRFAIEHIMPKKWHAHYPVRDTRGEASRDQIIHTLGNLTLLTTRLNSKVSNGPWLGDSGKRKSLSEHDVLFLNNRLLKAVGDTWDDENIRNRTRELARAVVQIWPVPLGHRSGFTGERQRPHKRIDLSDLIASGALEPGMPLFPRRKQHVHRVATLLAGGHVEVDGVAYSNPSDAAIAISGKKTSGWWFFLVDQSSKRSLRKVRRDYIDAMAVDADDDEADDDGDDEGDEDGA